MGIRVGTSAADGADAGGQESVSAKKDYGGGS